MTAQMDEDDRCWAIIAELDKVGVSGRLEYLTDGKPFVRVALDDYYVIDCQIVLNATFIYTVYVRRYDLEGNVVSEHAPYQAAIWAQAAKCIELAHRCHEVQIRDDVEQLMHALESL
jgi:hypothetical protein